MQANKSSVTHLSIVWLKSEPFWRRSDQLTTSFAIKSTNWLKRRSLVPPALTIRLISGFDFISFSLAVILIRFDVHFSIFTCSLTWMRWQRNCKMTTATRRVTMTTTTPHQMPNRQNSIKSRKTQAPTAVASTYRPNSVPCTMMKTQRPTEIANTWSAQGNVYSGKSHPIHNMPRLFTYAFTYRFCHSYAARRSFRTWKRSIWIFRRKFRMAQEHNSCYRRHKRRRKNTKRHTLRDYLLPKWRSIDKENSQHSVCIESHFHSIRPLIWHIFCMIIVAQALWAMKSRASAILTHWVETHRLARVARSESKKADRKNAEARNENSTKQEIVFMQIFLLSFFFFFHFYIY